MCKTFVDTTVMYTLQLDGKFYVIENVPSQVCKETGEEFFSPETVENIQKVMRGAKTPVRKMETPVFEYAELISHPVHLGPCSTTFAKCS